MTEQTQPGPATEAVPSAAVEQAQRIKSFIEVMPTSRLLGIKIIHIGDGRSVVEMPVKDDITFDGTNVTGAIVGLLGDYAAMAALGSTLATGWRPMTLSCETHNLLPASGQRLIASGEVLKTGRRHLVARADVYIDRIDGPLCLTGLFTGTGVPPQ